MTSERLLADVLQGYCEAKKTGAIYISVMETSENLVRFYFKDGELCHLSYGPVKDRECLDILACYDFGKAVFFEGLKPPALSSDLPKTAEIIAVIKQQNKKVMMD